MDVIDFSDTRNKIREWKKKHSMFYYDIQNIENVIESHIKRYSSIMVEYRRTRNQRHLTEAQIEIDKMNELIDLIEKYELMSLLSR